MRGRGRAAWFVSVVGHALVVWLLLRIKGRTGTTARSLRAPSEIEIELNQPSRPAAPRPSLAQPARDRSSTARREATSRRGSRAKPTTSVETASSPPVSDDPRADASQRTPQASGTKPGPGGGRDLSLEALSPALLGQILGPAPEAVLRHQAGGRPSIDELRDNLEREEDAVANVQKGRVDPVLYEYLRGARDRIEDQARRLAEAIELGPEKTLAGWGRGYLRRVEDVQRKDAAEGEEGEGEGPDLRDKEARQRPDLFPGYNEGVVQAHRGAEQRFVEICLDVAPARETVASVRRGSGTAALDRLALDAFTRSIAARPVPPDARAGLACYEIRISAFRVPPAPTISCGYGRKGVECAWPLKKITSVTAQLLSVAYPPPDGASASRSLLRRPR